jgi:predicted AAA+ superfamily ATPase
MGPRQVGKSTFTAQLLEKLKTPSFFVSADGIQGKGEEQQWQVARMSSYMLTVAVPWRDYHRR